MTKNELDLKQTTAQNTLSNSTASNDTQSLMAGAFENVAQIEAADTSTLRRELANALTLTAKTLNYLAMIWQVLEKRGEDLSDLRTGLSVYLPRIAEGTLDAGFVVKYAGQRMLMQAVGKLPIEQQAALAQSGHVVKVVANDKGDVVKENVQLQQLSSRDVRFIFVDDHLRSASEQLKLREREAARKERKSAPRMARVAKMDEKSEVLSVGGRRVKVESVLSALSEAYGVDMEKAVAREKELRLNQPNNAQNFDGFTLSIAIRSEASQGRDKVWVATCPELDIASQGTNVVEAASNLCNAMSLFLEDSTPESLLARTQPFPLGEIA